MRGGGRVCGGSEPCAPPRSLRPAGLGVGSRGVPSPDDTPQHGLGVREAVVPPAITGGCLWGFASQPPPPPDLCDPRGWGDLSSPALWEMGDRCWGPLLRSPLAFGPQKWTGSRTQTKSKPKSNSYPALSTPNPYPCPTFPILFLTFPDPNSALPNLNPHPTLQPYPRHPPQNAR